MRRMVTCSLSARPATRALRAWLPPCANTRAPLSGSSLERLWLLVMGGLLVEDNRTFGRCWRVNEDVVPDRADGYGRCRWVGRVGKKEERQEMPAARPSCALTTYKLGLLYPLLAWVQLGIARRKLYLQRHSMEAKSKRMRTYLIGCTCETQAKEARRMARVASYLSGMQPL